MRIQKDFWGNPLPGECIFASEYQRGPTRARAVNGFVEHAGSLLRRGDTAARVEEVLGLPYGVEARAPDEHWLYPGAIVVLRSGQLREASLSIGR